MKNKSFKTLYFARAYYNQVTHNYVAFLIHNRESDMYEVTNQDLYDHYDAEFDLDMELLDFYC